MPTPSTSPTPPTPPSSSKAFTLWWSEFQRTGQVGALRLGATRDDIRALFGEPDQVGGVTRKHKQPRLWKYGPVEFHFGPDDRLFLVYLDSGELERRTILRDPTQR
jgi:hypothetical protein